MVSRRRYLILLVLSCVTFLVSFILLGRDEDRAHLNVRPATPPPTSSDRRPISPTKTLNAVSESADKFVPSPATFLHGVLKGTATAILYRTSTTSSKAAPKPTIPSPPVQDVSIDRGSEALRIAITEVGGPHDEVVASLVHAFGSQKNAELSVYLFLKRYGIEDVIQSFSLNSTKLPIRSSLDFPSQFNQTELPHIVVSATCEIDLTRNPVKRGLEYLLDKGQTYMFCVVHDAGKWGPKEKAELVKPWIQKERITFITLSPHTAEYFRKNALNDWHLEADPPVRYFIPVFPAPLPSSNSAEDVHELGFAIQGNFNPSRRDYAGIFKGMEQMLQAPNGQEGKLDTAHQYRLANMSNATLHIIGHGNKPAVPAAIAEHVRFNEGLNHTQYYGLLSRTFALIPAIAGNESFDRTASSSIPAALIGGTPLVSSQEILRAYSYLPRDAVWIRVEGETDMDVVARVLSMPAENRRRKREMVRKRCAGIVQGNSRVVGEWIDIALQKLAAN